LSTVQITQLRLGQVTLPEFHPAAPGTDTIFAFLVREQANCVLVDTGVGTGSETIRKLYRPECRDLAAVLAEAGASLGDVTAVVNSHLHFDHCGNNSLFPGVPIFVQQAELDAAQEQHYTVPEWVDFPGVNFAPIRGRHSLSDRLELVPTPGHTPGHQSLLVRSDDGIEIVVAQAAYSTAEFRLFHQLDPSDPAFQSHLDLNASWSREAYLASLRELQQLRPQRAFFSHDAEPWERAA
jgi:glyoxylase-like metal-dependent hydrolase (beta-lactamase superfamily II)